MDVVIFIAAIAAFILLHELGHFIGARLVKINAEEFGLGLPPRILTLFRWQGTDFTLNALPLGGFVRMSGENDPDVPGGFGSAAPWRRFVALIAGPLMNLLTAVVLYAVAFSTLGVPDPSQVLISWVQAGSPAEQAGIQPNDVILEINGVTVTSQDDVSNEVKRNGSNELTFLVQRGEETLTLSLIPLVNPPEDRLPIGIQYTNPSKPISVVEALPYGLQYTANVGYSLLTLPVQLANGLIAPEDARLVGFKGMYDMSVAVKEAEVPPGVPGWFNQLTFFAMITTSLGTLNLLPIPALDGGRILFLLPEVLFRKRIPARFENAINTVSYMLLLALLVYVNLQDFINPIQINP